ncbi:AAA family ATPase [Gemmata sp. JC673]|uniref:AAA family ATPase n=1 Tax=Gemmata algarum TaxID=2975278 RepID=A0ABU5F1M8_9BACT|nr:AAA family ATPase [Gemmata algarum]MDY3560657.1 AAA family ATPase [Gemmata algarum]
MATATDPEVNGAADARSKPPFLRRVRIRGYKSIAFCDVALEPLTVLVGRNASGKSNFLDALGFLRNLLRLGASEAAKIHGGIEAILCRVATDRTIAFEIECNSTHTESDDAFEAAYAIEIEFPQKQRPQIRGESLRIANAIGDQMGYSYSNGSVECFASGDRAVKWEWEASVYPFLVRYHNELRAEQTPWILDGITSLSIHNFQPSEIRQLQHPYPGNLLNQNGANLASVIEATRENDWDAFERVRRYLHVITKTVELRGLIKYGADYETVRFQVSRDSHGQPLDFDAASMSDGTLRVLAALVAAFQVVPVRGSPSLVAIEEPETSLHPAAMHALVDALDEATLRTQILLTTHSAEMLDNPTIRPENIRVVQMIDGRTVIAPVDAASVEIVKRRLNTLGGLERDNLLEADPDDVERQQQLEAASAEPPK